MTGRLLHFTSNTPTVQSSRLPLVLFVTLDNTSLFNMGFDARPSNGLVQTQSTYNTSTFSQLPQSPSSLPDTSNQQSNSNHASVPAWSTQSVQRLTQNESLAVPAEQRQNPRRSSAGISKPPTLVRQDERKVSFVDGLVGKFKSASSMSTLSPLKHTIQTRPHKWSRSSGLFLSPHHHVAPALVAFCRSGDILKRPCADPEPATRHFRSLCTT